jgi:hypothetical protein
MNTKRDDSQKVVDTRLPARLLNIPFILFTAMLIDNSSESPSLDLHSRLIREILASPLQSR